ncbi:non-ribosomal peptide synthetase, partial [Pseudomonas sp. MWU16-30317]|uniref:non-ribosomal peptide synthetase n=1 Tax=Pseudomonas sp. MWU16-30317 TaxID=2878095 RepID=UPI001CF97DED
MRSCRFPPLRHVDLPTPASYAQERQWFLWQLDPQSAAYHVCTVLRLRGALDGEALQASLDDLLMRHESLRTCFFQDDGVLMQQVLDHPIKVQRVPGDEVADDNPEALNRWIGPWRNTPFDLVGGPLLRVVLAHVSDNEHVLALIQHHIICDGVSMQLMVDEWMRLYQARCTGRDAALAPLPVQYADYGLWQRRWMEAGERDRQLAYWTGQLGHEHPILALPLDKPRPRVASHRGARQTVALGAELVTALRAVAQAQGVTLFMLLLASYQVLLHRYSGQTDIRIGVPVANRNRVETLGLIGLFVNTQVLRVHIEPSMAFEQLLGQVRDLAREAQAHQDLPFEQLVEALQPERSLDNSPLFQAMFNHQSAAKGVSRLSTDLQLERLEFTAPSAKVDLTLETHESEDGVHAAFIYRSELFEAATVQRLAGHWRTLLQALCRAPDERIGALQWLDEAQIHHQRHAWQVPLQGADAQLAVHRLFESQAVRVPERIAVVAGGSRLSYRQIDNNANALAAILLARGVSSGEVVGVIAERTAEFVITVLALFKLGAAYLPLEPGLPAARCNYLLLDAGVRRVVGGLGTPSTLPQAVEYLAVVADPAVIAAPPDVHVAAQQLAYVIYTSGTTGQPKGVAVSQAALSHYVRALSERWPMASIQRMAMVSTPASDLGHTVFFGALCAGKTLHLVDHDCAVDAIAFARYSVEHQIDALKIVPSHLEALMAVAHPADVLPRVCLVVGGEAISADLLARIHQASDGRLTVINHYGPTETTVGVLTAPLHPGLPVTLGTPLARCRVAVLDGELQWLPAGVGGELYIGGAGLAQGYLGRAALTAERFVPDPFDGPGGARLYRSGDRASHLADGRMCYLGRVDEQIKVRGFRVEPSEIVSVLQDQPQVREALVIARPTAHGAELIAYVVAAAHVDAADSLCDQLRARLEAQLPDYLVPAHFMRLPCLPLTPNGKLDRAALPAPRSAPGLAQHEAAANALEHAVAQAWAAVLGVERVGRRDNFFRLGGHSLLAIQMIARLRQQAGIESSLRALFDTRDLAGFAALARVDTSSQPPIMPRFAGSGAPCLSYAQQRQWILWQLDPGAGAYNIPAALRLTGALHIDALQRSFSALIARHETLRTRFAEVDGLPVQVIESAEPLRLVVESLPDVDPASVQAWVAAEAAQPFDLQHGPLLRVRLLRVAYDQHVLTLTLHHIVSDGWSTPILVRELIALYEGFCQGREVSLPALPIQYADYAQWQRQWMDAGERERQLAYWQAQLGDEQPVLELPMDRLRPARSSFRGARLPVPLSPALSQALQGLARERGVTLFMLLLASFQTLLHRYSGQRDI